MKTNRYATASAKIVSGKRRETFHPPTDLPTDEAELKKMVRRAVKASVILPADFEARLVNLLKNQA